MEDEEMQRFEIDITVARPRGRRTWVLHRSFATHQAALDWAKGKADGLDAVRRPRVRKFD